MADTEFRFPVLLQDADADFSLLGDVRMERFGDEESLRGHAREIATEQQLDTKDSTLIRSSRWSLYLR
jgi:hypothetical protein